MEQSQEQILQQCEEKLHNLESVPTNLAKAAAAAEFVEEIRDLQEGYAGDGDFIAKLNHIKNQTLQKYLFIPGRS